MSKAFKPRQSQSKTALLYDIERQRIKTDAERRLKTKALEIQQIGEQEGVQAGIAITLDLIRAAMIVSMRDAEIEDAKIQDVLDDITRYISPLGDGDITAEELHKVAERFCEAHNIRFKATGDPNVTVFAID